jgi:Putative DNA-binding domain
VNWTNEIKRIVEDRVRESRVLDFKQALALDEPKQRADVLSDLSGMANGGGGTVIYGIAESKDPSGAGIADRITPLVERSLVGRVLDILRDTIQPPLVLNLHEVDVKDGYVLVVELLPGSLGPHMVETAKECRYYTRTQTSIVRMSEQQVRDAYDLATRRASQRDKTWAERSLPPRLEHGSWMTVSVVPHEPLISRFRAAAASRSAFTVPVGSGLDYQVHRYGLSEALDHLRIWAHGLAGEGGSNGVTATSIARIHEDGALACGLIVRDEFATLPYFARSFNGLVAWAAWMLHELGVPTAIEVVARVNHIDMSTLTAASDRYREMTRPKLQLPAGVEVEHVEVRREFHPRALGDASERHRLVRDLTDRISAAFGIARRSDLFESGALFDRDGRATGCAVGGQMLHGPMRPDVNVFEDGALIVAHNSQLLGHLIEGVVVDPDGNTLAVTELATGDGCPGDFLALEPGSGDPDGPIGAPIPGASVTPVPVPTGQWAQAQFLDHLNAVLSVPIS